MMTVLAVAIGGAVGSVARYSVGLLAVRLLGERFGYGTLIVNVVGCFLLGLLAHGGFATTLRSLWMQHPGLTVGLLGGLTTFSTFGYQTIGHIERGEFKLAVANIAANVVLGCAAAAAGIAASKSLAAG